MRNMHFGALLFGVDIIGQNKHIHTLAEMSCISMIKHVERAREVVRCGESPEKWRTRRRNAETGGSPTTTAKSASCDGISLSYKYVVLLRAHSRGAKSV